MQLRNLLLLGIGAGLAMNVAAFAAPPVPAPSTPETATVVPVATKAEEEALKKKKKAAAAKSKSKTAAKPLTEQEKKAAKAKAEKEKLAKAKALKEKQLAKAKADKEKQLAKAKAEREKQLAAAKAERDKKLAAAKVEKEKRAAQAKVEREKMMAERAKAAEERKIRLAKEAEERKVARAKAADERRLLREAKAKAIEEQRLAKIKAEEERQRQVAAAAEAARQAELARLAASQVVQTGNNGELRSETAMQAAPKPNNIFANLFGGQQVQKASLLPETRALDAALELKGPNKRFKVPPEYEPQVVQYNSGYPRGTIIIDTAAHRLYLMEGSSKARRYAIAVGKDGLQYKGTVKVGDKQEWPRWIPTKEMQAREPAKYGRYADGMPGGGANPLGARAIYLYENGRDTHLRIHGTIAPETIGTDSSNGCFRMINEHVMDLYKRVPVGTQVIVL